MIRWLPFLLLVGAPVSAQLPDAGRAMYEGRYDDAIAQYRRALSRTPASVEATRGLVEAFNTVGRYDDALGLAGAFVREQPNGVELANALGETLVLVGRRAEAESSFTRAVERRASDALVARLNLAVAWHDRGDVDRARNAFDGFIDVYNSRRDLSAVELTAVAEAVRRLSVTDPRLARDALRAYDQAIAADTLNPTPRVLVGELFLERYNGTEALAAFEGVLKENPRHPRALLGLARAQRFVGDRGDRSAVMAVLDVNPRLVGARVLLAEMHAEVEDYEGASNELGRALAVNPASLEALAALAGVRYLEGETAAWRDAERRVLALNPRYAKLYVTLAELAARNRLYHAAVEFARRATEVDSLAWRGYALLGINQLRTAQIDSGVMNLERAFDGDPFDVWTRNTLELLDDLVEYPETRSPRFRFYVSAKESELLSLYLAPLAEAAYDSLAARYAFEAPTPIRVEMFPNHADFSVRTVGLVGLGALGVSFGPVVAMDSPSAPEARHSNWGSVLWHELAHSFHMAVSDHRVPRWFTEGCAVYEERRARPGWGADASPVFLIAFLGDRLKPVSELNEGFMRPEYPEQVGFSYYQASLVCEMIERDHGPRALIRMLEAYGDGRSTEEAFREVLGADLATVDERFDRYMRSRFGATLEALGEPDGRRDPGSYRAQVAMGRTLLEQGRFDDAVEPLERAKALFPEYAGPDSPYHLLAEAHTRAGRRERAARELTALVAINADDYGAYEALAGLLVEIERPADAARYLELAMYVSPFEVEAHRRLAALAEELEWFDVAIRERSAVVALDPVNRAEALYRLAHAQLLAGATADARRSVLNALEQAPGFEAAQELLLRIHERERP